MKLENWLKENGFDSWEQVKENGDILWKYKIGALNLILKLLFLIG